MRLRTHTRTPTLVRTALLPMQLKGKLTLALTLLVPEENEGDGVRQKS